MTLLLVLKLTLVQSHLHWGELDTFSTAYAIYKPTNFVPLGTHNSWLDSGSMTEEIVWLFYT